MKKFLLICVAIVTMVGMTIAAMEYRSECKDTRSYIELTDENRSEYSKYDIYTQYDCGIKVNWNWTNDKGQFNVITEDGFDQFWSKEAIAKYVSNSKTTNYFGE